jgi:antirestriction protein
MARKTRKNPLPRAPETPAHVRAASRGGAPGEQSSLFKLQQMVREREGREFDPSKRGTWRGSSKDIVVNKSRRMRRNPAVELHAQPYGDGPGFYFNSYEDYEAKYDQNFKKYHLEEYEIQFIDGDASDAKMFDAMEVNQATIKRYFEVLDELGDYEKVGVWFLLDRRITDDVDEAIKKAEDVMLREGTAEDYVHELLDEGIIGEDAMARYFDYDAFGRDIRMDFEEDEAEETEKMSDQEVGEWYIDQVGEDQMVEIVKRNSYYFDTEAFARDLDYNSGVEEFTFDGKQYVVTNMLDL